MAHSLSISVMTYLEGKKGLSYREMAELVSVHPSEVSRIKAGTRKWTLSQLERLAEHFDIPLSVFLLDAMRDLNDHQMNAELRYYLEKAIEELDKLSTHDLAPNSPATLPITSDVKVHSTRRLHPARVQAIDIPA